MQVAVFVSGTGGNLNACLELQRLHPQLINIELVIADRHRILALEIAERNGVRVIAEDFERTCGIWKQCVGSKKKEEEYTRSAVRFHDAILRAIEEHETQTGAYIDLCVLSYRRWVHGALLERFRDRMINQHAGDLTARTPDGTRIFTGINPVWTALCSGVRRTRTSTFLVNDGHDAGEILCQGPWVNVEMRDFSKRVAADHEIRQKRESDWPSLAFALREIALGKLGIAHDAVHSDGLRIVTHNGHALPYGGVDLDTSPSKQI